MEPRRMFLWQTRLVWFGMITSPLFYCFMAFMAAMQQGASVLEWGGFLGDAPPVRASVLLPASALLGPVVLVLLRVLIVGPAGGEPDAFATEREDEQLVLGRMMRRQVFFMALGDVLPSLALIHVFLWGMMPLLWLVSAEYIAVMALSFPRMSPGPSDER